MTKSIRLVVLLVLVAALNVSAQSIYATLTGVVSDPASAVIPGYYDRWPPGNHAPPLGSWTPPPPPE